MKKQTIEQLIDNLTSSDPFLYFPASLALALYGEPAVNPLIQLLDRPEAEIRMRTAWALGLMGPTALPLLLELVEGNNPPLRIEAIRILGVIGEGRTLKQLLRGLSDPNPLIAARAACALGKLGDPRAYHALLTALQHPIADVRFEACRALEYLRVSDAAVHLLELAEHDQEQTSWGASVADVARRAANDLRDGDTDMLFDEFARLARILSQTKKEGQ